MVQGSRQIRDTKPALVGASSRDKNACKLVAAAGKTLVHRLRKHDAQTGPSAGTPRPHPRVGLT